MFYLENFRANVVMNAVHMNVPSMFDARYEFEITYGLVEGVSGIAAVAMLNHKLLYHCFASGFSIPPLFK